MAGGQHSRRRDAGTARVDDHLDRGVVVEALVVGHVIARELRLGHLAELQDQLLMMCLGPAGAEGGQHGRPR